MWDDVAYMSFSIRGWVKHRTKVIKTISMHLWHFMYVVISNVFQWLKHQREPVFGDQSILCITASLMQRMKSMWGLVKWWHSNIHNSTFGWGPIITIQSMLRWDHNRTKHYQALIIWDIFSLCFYICQCSCRCITYWLEYCHKWQVCHGGTFMGNL